MQSVVEKVLTKGFELHNAGQIDLAKQLYGSVIKLEPRQPDANHNLGVIEIEAGKGTEAKPLLRIALEANPDNAQYWVSYIDLLIRLEEFGDAQHLLTQAIERGAKGPLFDQLEKRLEQANTPFAENDGNSSVSDAVAKASESLEPSQAQLQTIINIYSQGHLEQALLQAKTLLEKFPHSAVLNNNCGVVNEGLGHLDAAIENYEQAITFKPDYPDAYNNMSIALKRQGKLEEAIEALNKALSLKPDYAEASYNMGNALKEQHKLDEAVEAYKTTLSIKPDYAEACYNMGTTLREQGKLDEAVQAYIKAASLNPDDAETHNNLGVALQEQGRLDEAVDTLNKALAIKPSYADAFNNMGVALQQRGKLEEAIEALNKALAIKPDYADAFNNLGNALQKQGKVEKAIEAFNKALAIKPNYADAAWNLSGTAENISESKNWLEQCLKADPNHLKAKLTLSALQFYEGDKTEFNALMQSSSKDHSFMRSFAWAFELPELPELFFHRWALFDRMVELSKKARPFYEYGVWRGEAFQHLINTFKKGYGFDSFEGIPEDWHDEKAGTYSSDGNIPQIEGGQFIVGKFEDSLPAFFSEPRPMASIINFDADLYSSTICALNFSKPVIDKHTILIFDEFIINKNWEQDEYKALNEFCLNNNYTYEVLAISFFTKQAAVRLIGI